MSPGNSNSIGIVRHGYSSEDIDAQLSKIEDMVKRSIDQKLRFRNFDARGNEWR